MKLNFDDFTYLQLKFLPHPQVLMSAVEAGLDVSSLPANLTTRWDIASAWFFCGTIITTIGTVSYLTHCLDDH